MFVKFKCFRGEREKMLRIFRSFFQLPLKGYFVFLQRRFSYAMKNSSWGFYLRSKFKKMIKFLRYHGLLETLMYIIEVKNKMKDSIAQEFIINIFIKYNIY